MDVRANRTEFGVHLQFDTNMTDINGIIKRIAVEVAEATDNLILDAIGRIAEEQGITDLYVLNKHNIAKALKKQIPKKPRLFDCDYSYFECDSCGAAIFYSDEAKTHKYCLNCGQALDWSEVKE